MALETLKDVEEIGGFPVAHQTDPDVEVPTKTPHDIYVNHHINTITFRLQDGPIGEVGVNGCQVDTIIEAAKLIIEGLDEKFPNVHNGTAILHLHQALLALKQRTADREKRGVEGTNAP